MGGHGEDAASGRHRRQSEPCAVQCDAGRQGAHRHGRPPDQQQPIEKGVVADGKATFQVQIPDGPLYKFTLTNVEGRLKGKMTGERDGVVGVRGAVDAAKAK